MPLEELCVRETSNSLDFSSFFCHHEEAMQRVEKWRIEELSSVLTELVVLLRSGDNAEWANVFSHYNEESCNIISGSEFNLNALHKLVRHIKNCFFGTRAFSHIILWHDNPEERTKLNRSLSFIRARLLNILKDIEDRLIEHIH